LIRPRVFLADDHLEFLAAEMRLLGPHFELVGTATDGALLISKVQCLKPDVAVVDINMPVMNGIDAVHKLIESGCVVKFVFLTISPVEEIVRTCLKEGALGYVWKPRMNRHLVPAIYAALEGRQYTSPLTHL
jgi:DNA-binding NarL/FixJ family response regulator